MPNHVRNRVVVTGPKKEVDRFRKLYILPDPSGPGTKDLFFDFNRVIPMPKEIKSNIDKYGAADSLDWAVANWGTKWNSYDFSIIERLPGTFDWSPGRQKGRLEFVFNTAWSPPGPVLLRVSELHPSLKFDVASFDEHGNFACRGTFEDGESAFECGDATQELSDYVYGPE